jgi:hypothetical protein
VNPSPAHRRLLELWAKNNQGGRQLLQTLPYALAWLRSHGRRCRMVPKTELWDCGRRHRVEMGRPSLGVMLYQFTVEKKLQRQCLIPYFKKAGANELLVFERGPNWQEPGAEAQPPQRRSLAVVPPP